MKRFLILVAAIVSFSAIIADQAEARSARVSGYTKRSGSYVMPHYRTTPDRTRLNNWSTRGNVNPYTGKVGTQNP